jgi:signal transduction histidine kinase
VKRFLEENETIILFAQGLVFFSLGFAVWIQRRRATRLRLTQSLIWLAGFAFLEALAVWGYVFVPIQESYLGTGIVDALIVVRGILQTVAFLFLLQFGLRLAVSTRRTRRAWSAVSVFGWMAILIVAAVLASEAGWSVGQWERSVEALCRHVILLPACLLAAYGLWRQREELAAAGMRAIRPYAAATAGALLVYALLAGVVVDYPFWSPGAAALDAARFSAAEIQLAVLRGITGLVLSVLSVKLLEIFDVEAKLRIESLDRARAVAEERARFGRDLHDGTIQSLYAAGLQLESVAITSDDPEARDQVRQVVNGLNATIAGIREYISDLRQPVGDPALLAARLEAATAGFAEDVGVDVDFRVRGLEDSGPVPDEAGQHLEQVVREALSNAARHGGSGSVQVRLTFAPDELDLQVDDDGCGIPAEPAHVGDGLRNIRERARRMGGRAQIGPAPGGGTRVAVAIPLDVEAPDETESQPQEARR